MKNLEIDLESQNNTVDNGDGLIVNNKEKWTNKIEFMLEKWKCQIDKNSELQEISGYKIKRAHECLTIPTIIIPFVMTFVSQAVPTSTIEQEQTINIVNGVMFMVISILGGISAFMGYGQLYVEHFSYSSRYSDLSNRIEHTLTRDRKYRTHPDIFVTEIKYNLNKLHENSSKIPMSIIKNYNN